MRLAVWSGPRNLSTAMMYCFGLRPDFAAVDEPFYAAYLAASGMQHPMQDAILASQKTNPNDVVSALLDTIPDGKQYFYQKHMTHHILPDFPTDWLEEVEHVFLIRHPARVLQSYSKKREKPTLIDIGFIQQLDLFQKVTALGKHPIVVDASDIKSNPEGIIKAICNEVGIPFDPDMLSWSKGPKKFDGVWAAHWYNAVHESTGFAPDEGPVPNVGAEYAEVLQAAMKVYDTLAAHKLTV